MGYAVYPAEDYAAQIDLPKVSPGELKRLIDAAPHAPLLVDVREQEEFAAGHIPGSINMPLTRLVETAAALPRDRRIILLCQSGARTYNAYRILRQQGYSGLSQAAFAEWLAAGLPVEK